MYAKPKILVSACLGFDACRYDASQIHAPIVQALEPFVDFVKVCPELAIGLSTPRESLRLIENLESPKLVFGKTGEDVTDKMLDFSTKFLDSLGELHGVLLKSRSPSCGTKDVKVYHSHGTSHTLGKGAGLFADQVLKSYSKTPIEEDGRLTNFHIREAFFYKIFTLADYTENVHSYADLLQFHTKHKYALMSYQPDQMTLLGRIVAGATKESVQEHIKEYYQGLKVLLMDMPSIGRNINTLTHLYGYFKKDLLQPEKEHFFQMITLYKNKQIPFSVLISMIHSWALRFQNEYLLQQSILQPFPSELLNLYDTGK